MKKRATGLLLAVLALSSVVLPGFAAEAEEPAAVTEPAGDPGMSVYLDGEVLETLEYEVYEHTCYVTVDSFVSTLDAEAMVEEENGVVTVTAVTVTGVVDVEEPQQGEDAEADEAETPVVEADLVEETLTLSAAAGDSYLVANGRYLYVEHGNLLVDGKIAAPIRVLAEVFNLAVDYDAELDAALLTHQEDAAAYLTSGDSFYDETQLYWLSHIIYAESGNQSLQGKLAVGNVVMNRVNSPLFPNDIYSVLFQKNQFSPAASGSIRRDPSEASVIAAKLVLDGAVVLKDALFFNAASLKNSYAARHRTYIATIGAHSFYA